MPTPSPGMKSSEFLLALVSLLVGITLVIFGVLKGRPELVEKGMYLISIATGTYSIAAGLKKFGTQGPALPTTDTSAAGNVAAIK